MSGHELDMLKEFVTNGGLLITIGDWAQRVDCYNDCVCTAQDGKTKVDMWHPDSDSIEVLYKADDETAWVVLSEETWTQPSEAEVRVRAETLCYFALLKTNATSSSSSGFVVGEGVVFGDASLAPSLQPTLPLGLGFGGRSAGGGGWFGDWWWLLLLLLLLLCCCCCVLFFFCFGAGKDEKKNIIITTEADAQGTLAHRRMVQTTSSTVSELHTASGATDDEAAFNVGCIERPSTTPIPPIRSLHARAIGKIVKS